MEREARTIYHNERVVARFPAADSATTRGGEGENADRSSAFHPSLIFTHRG
jgi:hypothetical protein